MTNFPTYKKVESLFANLKFAVTVILLFCIGLGYGTIIESKNGHEYAERYVYESLPFIILQVLMFLSILFATLKRLPPTKNLYGFYVIHLGLIILFIGSFLTYLLGVNGSLSLKPNSSTQTIILDKEVLLYNPSERNSSKFFKINLPRTASSRETNLIIGEMKVSKYLPYAKSVVRWQESTDQHTLDSYQYELFNDDLHETFHSSHHPESNFKDSLQFGPLNIHSMAPSLYECFISHDSHYFVWNRLTGACQNSKQKISNKKILEFIFQSERVKFRPRLSPFALDSENKFDPKSKYRFFNKKMFTKGIHLFLFGNSIAYRSNSDDTWETRTFKLDSPVQLPWMNLKINIVRQSTTHYPYRTIIPTRPVQENGRIVDGEMRAVEIRYRDKTFLVTSDKPVKIRTESGDHASFQLSKKTLKLPYTMALDQFEMRMDPGTSKPASFQSNISLYKLNQGRSRHLVSMNRPLKVDDFTFYQASYFDSGNERFGSVLSVNYDPGRPLKYLGSFMIILGSIWYFYLRRLLKKG